MVVVEAASVAYDLHRAGERKRVREGAKSREEERREAMMGKKNWPHDEDFSSKFNKLDELSSKFK